MAVVDHFGYSTPDLCHWSSKIWFNKVKFDDWFAEVQHASSDEVPGFPRMPDTSSSEDSPFAIQKDDTTEIIVAKALASMEEGIPGKGDSNQAIKGSSPSSEEGHSQSCPSCSKVGEKRKASPNVSPIPKEKKPKKDTQGSVTSEGSHESDLSSE